jgi:hypothetical protein
MNLSGTGVSEDERAQHPPAASGFVGDAPAELIDGGDIVRLAADWMAEHLTSRVPVQARARMGFRPCLLALRRCRSPEPSVKCRFRALPVVFVSATELVIGAGQAHAASVRGGLT